MTQSDLLSPGDKLVIGTPSEGQVGVVEVTSAAPNGQIIGKLQLTPNAAHRTSAAIQAANDAAEAFAFAAMDLEEANLTAISLQLELPDGQIWTLGRDVHNLLITEQCTHIAFKVILRPAQATC